MHHADGLTTASLEPPVQFQLVFVLIALIDRVVPGFRYLFPSFRMRVAVEIEDRLIAPVGGPEERPRVKQSIGLAEIVEHRRGGAGREPAVEEWPRRQEVEREHAGRWIVDRERPLRDGRILRIGAWFPDGEEPIG